MRAFVMSEGRYMDEDGEKMPREFYEGVMSIKNALEDHEVPKLQVDMALDDIEDTILYAMEHSGELDVETEIEAEE